jgi:hypothetical protein
MNEVVSDHFIEALIEWSPFCLTIGYPHIMGLLPNKLHSGGDLQFFEKPLVTAFAPYLLDI